MPETSMRAATEIKRRLAEAADPDRAEQEARYLKSTLRHIGVRVPATRSIVRAVAREYGADSHDIVVDASGLLWADPVHEHRSAAAFLLAYRVDTLSRDDLGLVESMLREARTWALVDVLAPDIAGPIYVADPSAGEVLDRWSTDPDSWLRRASLLTLLKPLRDGAGDFARFSRYADSMLDEREFFIRKAIGWILRDTARRRPELVEQWLRERPGRVPVLAVREAVKRLPPDVRDELLAAALLASGTVSSLCLRQKAAVAQRSRRGAHRPSRGPSC